VSQYQLQARICDDQGANCQAAVWVPADDVPTSSLLGLELGSPEYLDFMSAFLTLMALTWGMKFLIRFISGRK
jgi:hypothetical protein